MSAHEQERLSAWLDGELAPTERDEVEAHLSTCAECRARLAEMEAVDEKARDLPLEVPAGYFDTFAGRLRARIEAEGRPAASPRPARGRWRPPVWTWAAAAALILAVVTPLTMLRLAREGAPMRDREPRAATLGEKRGAVEAAPQTPATTAEAEAPGAVPALEKKEAPTSDDEARLAPKSETPRQQPTVAPRALAKGERDRRVAAPSQPAPQPPPAETSPVAPTAAPEPEAMEKARDEMSFAVAPPSEEESPAGRSAVAPLGRQAPAADATSPEAEEGATSRAVTGAEAAGRAASAMRAPAPAEAGEVPPALARASERDEGAFARLAQEPPPRNAAGWRERREAWLAFVAGHPEGPQADEARVRAIEAGLQAWRAGGDRADLVQARTDAEAYLARVDSQQAERVRRDLESIPDH